jgi:hypothetical protein
MWNMVGMMIPLVIGAPGIVIKRCKEKLGSHTRKIFDRFTTKDSHTFNITRNTESTAACNLKPER